MTIRQILMTYRGEEQTKIRNDKHMARRIVTKEVAGKVRFLFLYDSFFISPDFHERTNGEVYGSCLRQELQGR